MDIIDRSSARWPLITLGPEEPLRRAGDLLSESGLRVVFVIDNDQKLLGVITDGDMRRALLSGMGLDAMLTKVMNPTPKFASVNTDVRLIGNMMDQLGINEIPVLDSGRKLSCIWFRRVATTVEKLPNNFFVMAGGLGSRLGPYTKDRPKPLLMVNGKPMLERVLENALKCGFYNIWISINYLGSMIEDYFGDGEKLGLNIRYVREGRRLGTAGSLSLVVNEINDDIVVTNADVMCPPIYHQILDHHRRAKADLTLAIKDKDFEIPYGAIKLTDGCVTTLEEKPLINIKINAGVYILSPGMKRYLNNPGYYDMTDLIQDALANGSMISGYPMFEEWMDLGTVRDLQMANSTKLP